MPLCALRAAPLRGEAKSELCKRAYAALRTANAAAYHFASGWMERYQPVTSAPVRAGRWQQIRASDTSEGHAAAAARWSAAVAAGLPLSKMTLVVFGRSTSARQVHLEHLECSH